MHNKCIANGGESWYNVNSKKLQLGYKISVRLINPNKYAKIYSDSGGSTFHRVTLIGSVAII